MSRRMEWKDSNTSFGDIAAAMAVQSRSNEEMLARFDAYQKEHVAQQMLNADKERAFNTGQMLSDNAAGKDVNMDQPYDSLAYYQDAEKFKNDNRNYTLDETRANAMASHYKHLDVMNNMSDTAKAADARKTAMISAALRGTGGKKSGSSRYGSSKKGGGATTATDVLLNKAKAMGTEPYSGWFGLGGMDEEQMSKAGAMIETAFPGDISITKNYSQSNFWTR